MRFLRLAAGKTLTDVGRSIGLTETMLSRYELSNASVSTATLVRICKQLQVTPSVVLADVDTVVQIGAGEGPHDIPEMAQALLHIEDRRTIAALLALIRTLAVEE